MRGQATVELALGTLVLVTVITFGIHFAELGYLSLKVQDAAAFATWEATGRRVQDLETDSDAPFDRILSGPEAVDLLAQSAFKDFNGLSSVDVGSGTVVKGLTRGEALTVDCTEDRSLSFVPTSTAARVYFDRGGLACSAEARLSAVRLPLDFLQAANGFFGARNYDARGAASGGTLKVCSVGRATGGRCNGKLAVLLNDWGLAGERQKGECRLGVDSPSACNSNTATANTIYKDAVQRMWSPLFSYSKAFATSYAGSAPADPNDFWFSYAGLESDYLTFSGGEGIGTWNTGGPGVGGSSVPDMRVAKDCFLGKSGPGCP